MTANTRCGSWPLTSAHRLNSFDGLLESPPLPIDTDTESEILDTFRRGEKDEAIKRYQQLTGVGRKEAEDYLEELMTRYPAS